MPAFGVKRDGIPGRLNETWFKATKIGTFYGQCSELCGVGHGFMPIVVDVVSKDDFAAWVKSKQKEAGVASQSSAPEQKQTAPVTPAVSSKHPTPAPVIAKEKKRSKPTASNNNPAHAKPAANAPTLGNGNQPVPSKAAGDEPESAPSEGTQSAPSEGTQ